MYDLMMDCRDGPDRTLPPKLMAELAGLCDKLATSAAAVSFADLSRDFQPANVGLFDKSYVLATDTQKFAKGVSFWQQNTQPVTSARFAAGLSALVHLTGGDRRYSPEVSALLNEVELLLRS